MKKSLNQLLDSISFFQAKSLADSAMIEALIISHPDPLALREAWNRVSSVQLADAFQKDVSTGGHQVEKDIVELIGLWTEKLERYAKGA
jgi:hypothetical protein